MKFKTFLTLSILSIMCIQLSAQTFGVKAGLTMSNMLMKDSDDTYSDDFKMKPGFHVGGTAEFGLSDMIAVEAGLLLNSKGYKYEEGDYKMKTNLLYIDIPVTAKAKFDLGGLAIYGAAGPYIGIGVSGKDKYESDGESESEDIEWGSDAEEDFLKRLDFGLIFGAGVEVSSFTFGLNYGLGLANISAYTENGSKIANRAIMVSVGYMFGK